MRRVVLLTMVALLAGCDSPKRTLESLRGEIAEYKANPNDAQEETIEASFAKLETQIDELEKKGDLAEASSLRASAENLRSDYRAARMVRAMKEAQSAVQEVGEAFKEAGRSIGNIFSGKDEPTPEP